MFSKKNIFLLFFIYNFIIVNEILLLMLNAVKVNNGEIPDVGGSPEEGVPIIAVLFDHNFKIIFKPKCNKNVKKQKEREGCSPNDHYDNFLTHAEYMLLDENFNKISQMSENSLNLIITSSPCQECLVKISELEKPIKNVYYLSEINKKHKDKMYAEKFKDTSKKTIDDINVNFSLFNPFGDEGNFKLKDDVLIEFKNYMIKMFVKYWVKINFIDENGSKKNITYYKNDVRNFYDYLKLIEWSSSLKLTNKKADVISIKLQKIREWYFSTEEDLPIIMDKNSMMKSKKGLTIIDHRNKKSI